MESTFISLSDFDVGNHVVGYLRFNSSLGYSFGLGGNISTSPLSLSTELIPSSETYIGVHGNAGAFLDTYGTLTRYPDYFIEVIIPQITIPVIPMGTN